MKRKVVKVFLGVGCVALLGFACPTVMAAETETETVSEVETEAETEKAPDVEITMEDTVIANVENQSGTVMKSAVLTKKEAPEGTEVGDCYGDLVLTEEDGTEHLFEEIDLFGTAVLTKEDGFFFVKCKDDAEKEKTYYETADEAVFEEPLTMYVVNDVYIRQEANGDSTALGVASLGSEITVVGASPKWYHVEQGEIEGYVSRAYLSKDKENADAAVKAEEAALAQAQAEAAAQAAAAASAAAQSTSGSQGKYEVSREAYDDCDGSGHGYYEITYSDGSTAIEEY